jgi:GNAT superfamily N-acetyltransferase
VKANRLIRVADRDDADLVGQLLFDFNTEFRSPTPTAAQFAARLRRLLGLAEVLVLLACDSDGEPLGLALLTFRPTPYFDGPIVQLEDLYVRPAARGQGIGSAILTETKQRVRSRRGGELHVTVDEVDTDARRFYERHGFLNIEPGEDYRMLFYLHEM